MVGSYDRMKVRAGSIFDLSTSRSHDGGIVGLQSSSDYGATWALVGSGDGWWRVSRGDGAVVLPWTKATVLSPGVFVAGGPATALVTTCGPWLALFELHTAGGQGGDPATLIGTFYLMLDEAAQAMTP